jgi:hypothetical protein
MKNQKNRRSGRKFDTSGKYINHRSPWYDQKYKIRHNIIQLLHLNEINMRFYGAEYNNIERGGGECRVQYCCTLLHKTSY